MHRDKAEPPDAIAAPIHFGLLLTVMAGAGIAASMSQTLVVPLIPELPRIFDSHPANTSWIITVTLLVGAVSTPVIGRLADMYGKKPLLLIVLCPLVIGSVVCALSTTLVPMIIGRALQGVVLGLLPVGISLLHDILPAERAHTGIAVMSSSMGIGGALGIPLAAGMAQWAGWQVMFWGMAAIGVLVGVAMAWVLPSGASYRGTTRFDFAGALGLAAGVTPLLLSISKGSDWGWTHPLTLGGFVIGLGLLFVWGRYELRRIEPLVALRTTAHPVVLLTNLASVLFGFVMYGMNLIIPMLLQLPVEVGHGLGQSMFQMGLWYAPLGLGMFAISKVGASITHRRGPRITLIVAGTVIALGYGALAWSMSTIGNRPPGPSDSGPVLSMLIAVLIFTVVVGCGVGLAFAAMPTLILSAVPNTEKAAANGFNLLVRGLGTTTSAAVFGMILASLVQPHEGVLVPTLSGFVVAFFVGTLTAVAATIVAWFIPQPGPAAR